MPDLSLPEPVKGPEPLCKTTDHDVLKGMWGHAQQSELQYGPVDSSHKVRTLPARGANTPRPSSRPPPPCRAAQVKTNSVTAKIGQQWNTQFEQNGTSSPSTAPALCSARARPLRLPEACLTALGGSSLPGGGGRAIGRPATALGCSSYSRLQRHRLQRHRLQRYRL